MRLRRPSRHKQDRAAQAALLVAAASIPNSFQKTLMPRNTIDQGMVSGVTLVTNYSIISLIRKNIEDMAEQLAGTKEAVENDYDAHTRQRRFAIAMDTIILIGSIVAEKRLAKSDDRSSLVGTAKTGAKWLKYAAIAGLSVAALQELIELTSSKKEDGKKRVTKIPVGVIGGALFAGYTELNRRKAAKLDDRPDLSDINPLRAVAMSFGVLAVLGGVNYTQKGFADILSSRMKELFPGSEDFWWSTGHLTAVAGTAASLAILIRKVYHRIEEVAAHIEPGYVQPPSSKFVSSGPGSPVSWQSLSVQGRRYAASTLTKQQISEVMGRRAKADPIRIFVGLDSAPTENDRLDLALQEMERTGAFNRSVIMLISPTGTGYVNYVATEAAEFMSYGDIAEVVLQYSKRPSPMSLDRVPEGRLQFRMLVKAVNKRIDSMNSKKRPRVVMFGESLGAWTSQDAFIDQGTDGMVSAGVDKALWIGTPYGSKWKTQVLGPQRPDVEKELLGVFNSFADVKKLTPPKRKKLRYAMITHDNDAVALFGADLVFKTPDWLKDPELRPPTVPKSQYYTSPGTFLLTLIDMKNSMNVIPGKFEASGHDYRADLAEFVSEVYDFNATPAQLTKIQKALRQNELDRAQRLIPKDKAKTS